MAQTGTAGRIYAQKNGDFIDIDIVLTGCTVGSAYNWYDVGYVDLTRFGSDIKSTQEAWGQAYFSGGGPAYGDDGGKATIRSTAQASGRIQLQAQASKTFGDGKYFIASIHVPIS